MSALADDGFDDDLFDEVPIRVPVKRTKKQVAAAEKLAEKRELQEDAKQLAQIVNLMIAGHSLADIAAATGHTADEMDRLLARDMSRYVRNQPALRIFVRNFISSKYTGLLDAVWDEATDKTHEFKLENQDRALRILKEMARLHGAEAPTQTEVKVEAAPETVEKMVAFLAGQSGQGYDADVFDTVPGEVIHEAARSAAGELERSAEAVGDPDPDDGSF